MDRNTLKGLALAPAAEADTLHGVNAKHTGARGPSHALSTAPSKRGGKKPHEAVVIPLST